MTRLRALFWAILALLIGGLAYLLAVGSVLGQRAEASVLDASAFTTDPPAPLSLVSPVTVIVGLGSVLVVALWVHGIARTVAISLASALALLGSQLLKENWLERPDLLEFAAPNTFPSGHMTVFAVIAAALLWALPRAARAVTAIFVSAVLGVVSWQLLEFGWHRPSDLIGALALTLFSFAVIAWLGPRGSKRSKLPAGSMRSTGALRILAIIHSILGVIIVLGGLTLVAAAAATRSDPLMLSGWEIILVGASILAARTFARICP